MSNGEETGNVAVETTIDVAQLPDIFVVIHGTLTVPSNDRYEASSAFDGFQYLLAREFRRQQPALALLYELDFTLLAVRRGSTIFEWRLLVKLRKRVKSAIQVLGPAVLISAALQLPGAINNSIDIWHKLIPPVQAQLQSDLPHSPPTIVVIEVRPPDDRDIFKLEGGSIEL